MNESDITYEVLSQLGLYIRDDNTILSQDANLPVLFNGKKLKYSFNGPIMLSNDTEKWFDIFNDQELIIKLARLNKIHLFNIERIKTIKEIIEEDDKLFYLRTIYIINNEKVERITKKYKNLNLMYIEQILDYNIDLSNFDRM